MRAKVRLLLITSISLIALGGVAEGVAQAASPVVVTGSAIAVGTGNATMTGVIAPGGHAVSYAFQYGTTTKYGRSTPAVKLPASSTSEFVASSVTGLTAGTTYHYRLAVVIGASTPKYFPYYYTLPFTGLDRTFTTVKAVKAGKLTLGSNSLKVKHGSTKIKLTCPSVLSCKGKITLTKRVRIGTRFHNETLGSKSFSIKAGKSTTLKVNLSKLTGVLLLFAPHHKIGATLTAKVTSGPAGFKTGVTLRR
ncbi:MAG: hypothetical protein ACYDHH_01705 [Solirubrobacteraceae bacterium]